MDSDSESEPFLSKILDKDGGKGHVGSMEAKSVNDELRKENRGDMNTCKKESVDKGGNDNDHVRGEDPSSRKRKRECCKDVVDWIRNVAKDPCNPNISSLPERSKWKNYGNQLPWKQILLARDAMLLKKNVDKNQKMHPSMYDDDPLVSERLRCSKRLVSANDPSNKKREQSKRVSSSSDSEENEDVSDTPPPSPLWCFTRRQKKIPLGPLHQADLPEFCKETYESDPKWLGSQIWPLNKVEQNRTRLIERDPIGKGRQDSCGCQSSRSIDCVRFHVSERRKKMKLELGSAFNMWRLNFIGEEVALSWTKQDEAKFEEIVKSNCLSSEKYFWDELFKRFENKGREALVSYYFNVFLLRRRAQQNRSSGTSNIYSDDEQSEYGPVADRFGRIAANSPGSIFCSPKKSYRNT